MHPTTWKASGHVDSFNDPMIDNKDSKKRYRADVLLEEKAAAYELAGDEGRAEALLAEMGRLLEAEDLSSLRELILEEKIICSVSGTSNWTEVRQFNLMFGTQVGSVAEESTTIFLRPETAQGIFVNFLNVQKSGRMKIPFGIAQIGKAFRNEIVARQFIRPGTEMEWYRHWAETRIKWHQALGIPASKIRRHNHEKLAHYANAALDIEYDFPFGFKEVEGIHSRTDFDLRQHQEYSKKKQQYFDPEINQNYIPYVIETSIGADRLFLMVFCDAFYEEEVEGKTRTFLKFHPAIAPVKAAILPLTKKDGLPEKGKEIYESLKLDFNIIYEDAASIGKRYTRQDLIGTPFCIAVDHQTLEDNTVTIRHRDTTQQDRVLIQDLAGILTRETSFKRIFESIEI
jgi:glycyl-tRNA synthetase